MSSRADGSVSSRTGPDQDLDPTQDLGQDRGLDLGPDQDPGMISEGATEGPGRGPTLGTTIRGDPDLGRTPNLGPDHPERTRLGRVPSQDLDLGLQGGMKKNALPALWKSPEVDHGVNLPRNETRSPGPEVGPPRNGAKIHGAAAAAAPQQGRLRRRIGRTRNPAQGAIPLTGDQDPDPGVRLLPVAKEIAPDLMIETVTTIAAMMRNLRASVPDLMMTTTT